MKPFNLERALAGDPVVDIYGNEYIKFQRIPRPPYPDDLVLCFRSRDDGILIVEESGCKGGKQFLFMAKKKRTVWANVCLDYGGNTFVAGILRDTEAIARQHAPNLAEPSRYVGLIEPRQYIGTFPIEIEE